MNDDMKLTIKLFVIGVLVYGALGAVGFFTGSAPMMNEPPPYGIMVATLLVVLLGIQRTKSTVSRTPTTRASLF